LLRKLRDDVVCALLQLSFYLLNCSLGVACCGGILVFVSKVLDFDISRQIHDCLTIAF